jgi:hypothetical protein
MHRHLEIGVVFHTSPLSLQPCTLRIFRIKCRSQSSSFCTPGYCAMSKPSFARREFKLVAHGVLVVKPPARFLCLVGKMRYFKLLCHGFLVSKSRIRPISSRCIVGRYNSYQ